MTVWDRGPYELAEGARFVDGRLVFVDILTGRLLEAPHPGPARTLVHLDVPLGAVAPVAGRPGSWIAAAGTGVVVVEPGGALEWLDRPEDGGPVDTRMNDGGCDPLGRFWAGSMAYDNTPGAGSLYRVDAAGRVIKVLDGMTIVNGPAFDVSGSVMYVADTPTGRIHRHTLDAAGDITSSREFVTIPSAQGAPDGMAVDDRNRLWVALWGGSRVHCYDPNGSLHQELHLPARQPTSVCLTPDRQLHVTTAAYGLADAALEDGAVLRVPVDSAGRPATAWIAPS